MSRILGIESSCDETAAAIVEEGQRVLAESVVSQAESFACWGGVVPELAARSHVAELPGLVAKVLDQASCQPADLDAIAVTCWPGLIGSLLSGVTAAKILAARWRLPLIAVDHVQAHLAAVHLSGPVCYPALALVASGGHSHFYFCRAAGDYQILAGTIDDAAGEAFDKAAAILELGYPGGPLIDALAARGNPKAYDLPRSLLHSKDLRLSFAGLKTALLYQVRGPMGRDPLQLDEQGLCDAAASFQQAVVDILVAKLLAAAREYDCNSLILGGGVACNSALRRALQEACAERQLILQLPQPQHCADNAAMVACRGHFLWQEQSFADLTVSPLPSAARGPRQPR